MIKSKTLSIALVALSLFAVSCASGGMKKPAVIADQYNNIPADVPSQFLNRFERFINSKENDEFRKLLTDEARQAFIDKFWLERDTNPATPENEYKTEIDERIGDIAGEIFFQSFSTSGLLFRSNGGFHGDMAKVYLLHGKPDAMGMIEGRSFVPMMLWVYGDPANGRILYAFLFYKKDRSAGLFRLFQQDRYRIDQCGAIYEVASLLGYFYSGSSGGAQNCPPELFQVYIEIRNAISRTGVLDGFYFAWALFNFSQNSSLLQEAALQPPKPALEIAKRSKARITGEASKLIGTEGVDYILASCGECNSMIPAEVRLGKEFLLLIRRSDIDWQITGNQAQVELKVRVILESIGSQTLPLVFEKKVPFTDRKDLIISNPASRVGVTLLIADEVSQIPAGTYHVSIYVKNITTDLMTKKYNSWSKEFTK